MSKRDKCVKCSAAVGKKDAAIMCEACEKWFHAACLDIDATLYGSMQKFENLHWFCDDCNKIDEYSEGLIQFTKKTRRIRARF